MSVIDRIITTVKNNGLKQKDLVEFLRNNTNLKATETTISDWKSGKSSSYYTVIPNISKFLKVSCDYLLTGSETFYTDNNEITELYNKLDEGDQREVIGYIKGMLHNEKYSQEAQKLA